MEDKNLRFETTDEQKKKVIKAIEEGRYKNEKIWNFLIGYLLDNSESGKIVEKICEKSVDKNNRFDVWCECEPLSPLKNEGNTKIDLAFGKIKQRGNTKSGINPKIGEKNPWVCFVEGKLFSDISINTKYNPRKNQLLRVLENLLCFQENGNFPDELYFSLITPRLFKVHSHSRLYGYKWEEYKDLEKFLEELRKVNNSVNSYEEKDWYPNLEERFQNSLIGISWVSYEEIIEHACSRLEENSVDLTEMEQLFEKDSDARKYIRKLLNSLREDLDESISQ